MTSSLESVTQGLDARIYISCKLCACHIPSIMCVDDHYKKFHSEPLHAPISTVSTSQALTGIVEEDDEDEEDFVVIIKKPSNHPPKKLRVRKTISEPVEKKQSTPYDIVYPNPKPVVKGVFKPLVKVNPCELNFFTRKLHFSLSPADRDICIQKTKLEPIIEYQRPREDFEPDTYMWDFVYDCVAKQDLGIFQNVKALRHSQASKCSYKEYRTHLVSEGWAVDTIYDKLAKNNIPFNKLEIWKAAFSPIERRMLNSPMGISEPLAEEDEKLMHTIIVAGHTPYIPSMATNYTNTGIKLYTRYIEEHLCTEGLGIWDLETYLDLAMYGKYDDPSKEPNAGIIYVPWIQNEKEKTPFSFNILLGIDEDGLRYWTRDTYLFKFSQVLSHIMCKFIAGVVTRAIDAYQKPQRRTLEDLINIIKSGEAIPKKELRCYVCNFVALQNAETLTNILCRIVSKRARTVPTLCDRMEILHTPDPEVVKQIEDTTSPHREISYARQMFDRSVHEIDSLNTAIEQIVGGYGDFAFL